MIYFILGDTMKGTKRRTVKKDSSKKTPRKRIKLKYKNIAKLILLLIVIGGAIFFISTNDKDSTKKNENLKEEVQEQVKKDYKIPVVHFEGNISGIKNKKEVRTIKIKYQDENKDLNYEMYAGLKLQGTSSLNYEKKNYNITLYEDEDLSKKSKIDFGWGAQSKYCLKANWIDKTHARNIVTANLVADIQKKYDLFTNTPHNGTIDGYPVEIYLNGEFLGIYTWNIPKDDWMFSMDEDNENHIVFAAEQWNPSNKFQTKGNYNDWSIEVGRGNAEDLKKLNRLINFVNTSSDEEFKRDFDQYLDFDSTINYFIVMQYAKLSDNVAKNMLLVTYDGKVWQPSLYDLDTSWGTSWNGKGTSDYTQINNVYDSKLWKRMVELYPNEIAERYFELKKDYLNKDAIMKRFNDFEALIPEESFKKENERWENIPGFDYKQIEEFLNTREPIIDEYMNELKNK